MPLLINGARQVGKTYSALTFGKAYYRNTVYFNMEIPTEDFEKAVQEAYLKTRARFNIHGFRKGKAPRAFIEKYYGEGVFYEDALEAIYPDAVASAIEEAKLEPVDTPYDLEIPEMGNDGVTMKFKVTVKPEVELGEYKGLKATKKSTKVTADEVKAELARMQEQNSTVSDVDDRAVKKNDIVVIDFEGFVDGKAFDGGKAEKYELTIGSNQFIPGFEDQIIGHKIGDKFDVNVKFPEDYQADLASKDAVFKIKLHGIKVKEVPALDDEFAKDVSEFDTLDELKKDIKKQLEKRKNDDAENELHNTLLEEVAKGIKAEIPEAMIEKTIDDDVNEYSYRLQSQGLKLETYLKYTGMDMKGFREGFKERAETQVRLNLALEKIIEKEKIEVTEEDIEAEYKKYADAYNMDIDTIKKAVSAESLKPELASRKAIDLIVDSAVVTEEKAAKKTAEKKPATKKTTAKKPAAKKTSEKADDKKSADKAE